ncbi:MAG: GFA family protein [Thioclava marina]|uniref:Aldehyde-activating protein n=1 Tax=Thioclava marina TaxID=1915077 RepID=A0ABX3MKS3_9RHOB|nr:GFA family protein [Thioclava marina]MBC7146629.1 GFA family protein [Thioclava marina]OOY11835.1 aldehyde-activating protein [Thioclava marina]
MTNAPQDYPDARGGCQCGAIRFFIAAGPAKAGLCHCRMCQRATGNAFAPLLEVPAARVSWEGVAPSEWASSNISQRGFCPTCGTPLYLRTDDTFEFMAGCLSPDVPFLPQDQGGMEARKSWLDALPSLPAHTTRPELLAVVVSHQSKED